MEIEEADLVQQEYIGSPPGWITQHGTVLIGVFFLLFFSISTLIRYNDVIKSDITVTTSIPPAYIASKRNGIISEIRVGSGELVEKGQVLAVLQNTSGTEQSLEILEKINGTYDTITSIESLTSIFPPDYNLGEIQLQYNEFISAYQGHINFNRLQRESIKGEGLKDQALSQEFALNNQKRKLRLSQRRTQIAIEQFERQQGLFEKGVISQSELNVFEEKLIESEQNTQNAFQQLSLLSVESSKMKSAYLDSDLNLLELKNSYTATLLATRQELISSINAWKDNYLLIAPKDGKISIFDIWENYQNVEKDDFVFSVVPQEGGKLLGKLKVPLGNSGKIKKNQKVVIKLQNYPYQEWGTLEGVINHISDVPKKGDNEYYSLYVELKNLETSFGKTIEFKQEMKGSAEIILAEASLLTRIFYQFKSIWE